MRKTYETREDKANESIAADILTRRGYDVYPMLNFTPCDFLIISDDKIFLTEYKRRKHSFGTYKDVMIPTAKLKKLQDVSKILKWGLLYLIMYDDGMYGAVLNANTEYPSRMSGRTDRNDPQDIQLKSFIPNEEFYKI